MSNPAASILTLLAAASIASAQVDTSHDQARVPAVPESIPDAPAPADPQAPDLDNPVIHREYVLADGRIVEAAPGYASRAPTVYDGFTNRHCTAYYRRSPNILEDINFGPSGPWAATSNNIMRTLTFPRANSSLSQQTYDIRVTVWDSSNFATSPMFAPSGTPLYRVTTPVISSPTGYFLRTLTDLNILLPDNQVFIQLEFFTAGTTNYVYYSPSATARTFLTDQVTTGPGSTLPDMAEDLNGNGSFEGGAVNATEHTSNILGAMQCPGAVATFPFIITGDVPSITPPAEGLGEIGDAGTLTAIVPAGSVKWFTFTPSSDITDATRHFLDIDTIGSEAADTYLALFDRNGIRRAADQDGGPGALAQLSFGIGRRPASPGGEQFDGYDGELPSSDGPYYLAICQGPAASSDGFSVTPAFPGQTASMTFRIRSNSVSGTVSPSVPPDAIDLGYIVAPGSFPVPAVIAPNSVRWFKINLCNNIAATPYTSYLDLDFGDSDVSGDPVVYMFNTDGNLIKSSDNWTTENRLPFLSFGALGPRGPYNFNSSAATGQNGLLSAGTYYIAVGQMNTLPLPTAATDGRFHLRPRVINSLSVGMRLYTGFEQCPCAPCPADFNQDGGIDGDDVEAFFAAFAAGTPCADVNQDGGITGDDIGAFYTVFAQGGCP